MHIIFSLTANITNPRWKVRHGDQLIIQPGEISKILQVEDPGMALRANAAIFW
jgi:hypothetical protein